MTLSWATHRGLVRRDFIAATFIGAVAGLSLPVAQAASAPTVLVVGDSLSAEYGLKRGTGWVALLQKQLATEKINATVVNASISGDTTSGGRARLAALLQHNKPTHVVIELGGNDALRGLPLPMTEDNLRQMVKAAKDQGAKVLLLGDAACRPITAATTPSVLPNSTRRWAKAHQVPLVPFFLKGVADAPNALSLFQADRIHPREEAQPALLANVWPELKKLLK